MTTIFGLLATAFIGVSLGLIGGGGSIITIPVLVYLFHIEPTLATTYSLFIVGTTSLLGGVRSSLHNTVDFRSAVLFSIPSTLTIYFSRHYLLPRIPDSIVTLGSIALTKNLSIMIFFSIIMMIAAIRMIRDKRDHEIDRPLTKPNLLTVLLPGVVVGVVAGITGAGGGFLIIPALVLMAGLPMKKAVGTSLIIIAINSIVGFIGDLHIFSQINFSFMMVLSGLAIAGSFLGTYLSRFFNEKRLKSAFGWLALAMSIFILSKEIFT